MQEAPGILYSPLLFAAHIQMANLLSARSFTDKRKRQENSTCSCTCAHTLQLQSVPTVDPRKNKTHIGLTVLLKTAVQGRHMNALKVDRLGKYLRDKKLH